MHELHVPEDVDRFIELDDQFHRTIVAASGQRRVLQVWYGVSALLSILVGLSLHATNMTGDEIAERHDVIIAALCQSDPDIAINSITEHYRSYESRLHRFTGDQNSEKGDVTNG
jgi:DNA-binding GntR family transcriptional regulator